MPTTYTPAPKAFRALTLPSDGDPRGSASVLTSLQRMADLSAYTRNVYALNYARVQAQLAFEMRDIAAGFSEAYAQPPFGDVKEPMFLAAGPGILRSWGDGAKWDEPVTDGSYNGVAYDATLGLWAAAGTGIITSSDTFDWDTPTLPATATLRAICALSGTFVAVGDTTLGISYILRSTDGEAWAQSLSPFEEPLYAVRGFGGVFAAVGGTDAVPRAAYSEDGGDNWTEAFLPGGTGAIQGLTHDGERFVAITQAGRILRSEYGDAWDMVPGVQLGEHVLAAKLAADPEAGVIVAVDGYRGKVRASFDGGLTFEAETWPLDHASGVTSIAFGHGRFLIGANNGNLALGLRR